MTVCDVCGTEVDPDVICPVHRPGCDHEWCDCPEVCADCCQDTSCPGRTPEETPMTDPAPLTDEQIHELLARAENETGVGIIDDLCDCLEILFALVEQTRKERDDLLTQLANVTKRRDEVIELSADKLQHVQQERDEWRAKWERAQDEIDALVGDSIALRMARAGTERTTDA